MSSPRAQAAVKTRKPAQTASAPAPAATSALTDEATRLAATIEKNLAAGRIDTLTPQALQALMSASCKAYAAHIEAGHDLLPFGQRAGVSPTDVMVTASGLLRAVNLAVFELGMWQSWTGR
jgi:hypothetical protein